MWGPVAFVDEHVETFVSQYNDVYCDQRKAGVSGGDAERKAMKEVLLLALGAPQPAPSEPAAWRCFHCDEVFTELEAAELHFGKSEMDRPFCQIDVTHFRWMEAQHRRNVDDDSEALRTVGSLVGEHERLRRQAEELGYARGLADAQKHPEDLGLSAAPHPAAKGAES